jgi:hypothetical protein
MNDAAAIALTGYLLAVVATTSWLRHRRHAAAKHAPRVSRSAT